MTSAALGGRSSVAATRTLMLGLVVAVPLAVAPGTSPTRSYPRYVLVVAGAVVVLVVVGAGVVLGGHRPAWRNGLHWPVLGLVGWTALCAPFADDVGTAVGGYPGSYNGLSTTVSLAVVFFAAASLPARDGRRLLAALWFGAGGAVTLYGLVQLADRVVDPGGRGWDLVPPAIAPWSISSTLGNPNHLAGFAAMVLPVGAALFRHELLPVGRRVLPWMVGAGGVLLATAVALGAIGVAKRDLGSSLDLGAGSTLDLRVQLWTVAGSMTAAHPVVGVGPDGFASAFPDHVTDEFAQRFGVSAVATDAHNLFASAAANLGLPGLAAVLLFVGAAGRQPARAWRRRTAAARGGEAAAARADRLLLGGVAAGLVGYLVQASFNTQPVSLTFVAWTLLAVACILS
ncbi:MAG TPA: O-antigen ligase family protein, partial [Acidimicrobiales bacterium]|nr:O-antigen ligase family protein [Acidimicrobiales bacterium]